MLKFVTGNILDAKVDALVNTVNCVGIMGRGIALQFKKRYPQNFREYERECKAGKMEPGKVFTVTVSQTVSPRFVINFPTKRHWRGKSQLTDIQTGLADLVREIGAKEVRSVAIPPLGCGLGGLDWNEVKPLIVKALASLQDVEILVFEPIGAPSAEEMASSTKVPKMTPGRAALIGLINHYLKGLMDPFISLLEVHKLMYFMQEAGEPLRLDYEKHIYGPYALNLGHVMNLVEGHFITGYADGGDSPTKQIALIPGAYRDAKLVIEQQPDTVRRFEEVASLVDGFETPFGMELLATVHWVVKNETPVNDDDLVDKIYAWNDRKKSFTRRQILVAADTLKQKGWT